MRSLSASTFASSFASLFASSFAARSVATVGAACLAALALPSGATAAGTAESSGAGTAESSGARAMGTVGLQSLPLQPLEPRTRAGGQPAGPDGAQGLPPTDTDPFSLLGVIWSDAAAELRGEVEVRTRAEPTGAWSDWIELDANAAHAPDPGTAEAGDAGVRGGTAPLWVGPSDGVEVRAVPGEGDAEGVGGAADEDADKDGAAGTADALSEGLPEGLRLELIDPGETPEADGEEPPAEEPRSAEGEFEAPRPPITTRADWGADESLREDDFVYTDTIKTVFVHHTAGTNDYSCSDAPAIIRGIYAYHVESEGWRDIGYNFLVDKCGEIYEGRAGGVTEPVQGAHTLGFNHNSMGVSVLGTYSSTAPNEDILASVSLLTAWKLGLHDGDPEGAQNRTSSGGTYPEGTTIELNNVSGHRDGYNTDCPGDELYAELPTVRATAADLQGR
ncbi:N-acetylmuramoyl-L-alanine amidase [Streptomyces sp. NBC_01803]|uniref:N-acetylmuramoyl-L-alanine amidase n=1 Tax=Streptomyces sp. NBC_01803 TaxID=2975946 RepID=UPI002DDB3299|nr:N-acetylmuramoyl-L-alanine amidase [Streptomyces sp. NBC_01803]WSA44481.1 N-acetylmuramoyl-L-alanine amidase [Streptomyces sp. NBC_01803]